MASYVEQQKQKQAYSKLMKQIKDKKINFGKLEFIGVPYTKMSKKDLMCALAFSMSLNLSGGIVSPDGKIAVAPDGKVAPAE